MPPQESCQLALLRVEPASLQVISWGSNRGRETLSSKMTYDGSVARWPDIVRALLAGAAVLVATVTACRKQEVDGSTGSSPSPASTSTATAQASTSTAPRPSSGLALDPPQARRMRERLVRQIATMDRPWGGDDDWRPEVLAAMRAVPRHLFMPGVSKRLAYEDTPYPIGHDQTISQPTIVALMTQALALTGTEKVLEIGTGSGYQAAVLSGLVDELYSIEIVAPLGKAAAKRLAELGYDNVTVRVGDGYAGWPEQAPFDRILLTAAPPKMPAALVEQLREGGIVVAPVGEEEQWLYRWTKRGGKLEEERLGAVRFVPMVPSP